MVVMPTLTHGQKRRESYVATLYRGSSDLAVNCAMVMCQMTDEPMAEHAGSHASAHCPPHESPTPDGIKKKRQGELLRHPCAFQKSIETILGDSRLNSDDGRVEQHQLAIQLPPCIQPGGSAVFQVVVAIRESLRVIAQLVLTEETDRARESDLYSEVHEKVFEPLRTLVAIVDELSVATQRVAE